jgi:dUTP pyrophosphatase
MIVKILNTSNNINPEYATVNSAGVDLKANIEIDITLKPFERVLIPTGIYIEIPTGFEAQIRPRSGLALNHGITVLNSPGTIDSDYRGEIKVIIINLGAENYTIKIGDKISQMVFCKYEKINWVDVDSISYTNRGGGGFGHTGK